MTAATGARAGAWLTAPNLLSLSRIALAAALWPAAGRPLALVGLCAAAAVTDVLDGWMARRRLRREQGHAAPVIGPRSVGAWLDPLCDKIFVVSLLAALCWRWQPPLPLVLLIATREIVMVPAILTYRLLPGLDRRLRLDLRAGPAGKVTTVSQFLAAGAWLLPGLRGLALPLALCAAAAGAVTIGAYLGRGLRALRRSRSGD